MKSFWGFWAMTRPRFSQNVQRLKRHFKGFSQLFARREEVEEEETEIEIGYPTDVKHLTHIGWDGSTTINPIKGWENLKPPEIISFPSISIKQFELAMAAQADFATIQSQISNLNIYRKQICYCTVRSGTKMGFLVTTLIFVVVGVIASLCARICCNRGPSTNLLHLTLIITATVCCWMMWAIVYLAQLKPLIVPVLSEGE
ncbi:hypothetical protein MTR67_050075 [Solanum verrucosum]|nr:hypothetical protein MTR67_050075 [Solanum verrucosum]